MECSFGSSNGSIDIGLSCYLNVVGDDGPIGGIVNTKGFFALAVDILQYISDGVQDV